VQSNGRGAAGYAPLLAISLALLVTGCTDLSPAVPPTPAPVSTAPIVFATAAPVTAPASNPTPIPPPPTATRPAIPTPAPAAPRPVYVANTGGDGVVFRKAPGPDGERVDVLKDGTALTPLGPEQQAGGRSWRQVRDTQGREGWVAAELLSTLPSGSTASAASPVTDVATMIPTQRISLPPPPPTPTRAPTRTPSTSAPAAPASPGQPSTARPQAPAVVVPTISTRFSPPPPSSTPGR
jgi:hypothetical protein